ncbi:MAG: phosphatase PAP2 family protein, partial [Luteibaculum sp.]
KHFFSFLSGYLGAGLVVILGKLWLFAEVKRPKTVMDHYEFYHWVEGVSLRSNHSFPSGHTQAAFSVFCFFSLCTQNKVLQSLCLVAAILVGYSRIYISQHFLPDVVVGSFLGVSAMLISHHLWFRSEGKPWFHRSPFRKKA